MLLLEPTRNAVRMPVAVPSRNRFSGSRTLRRLRRRLRGFRLRSEGFAGRTARTWMRHTATTRAQRARFTAEQRAQAREWGFTPALVANFGITPVSRRDFLPLRDYLYAQPFNGTYAKWVRDRVAAALVFAPFRELFDTVHYQLMRVEGELRIVPLSPEAEVAGASIEGIAQVASERGPLAVGPSGWGSQVEAMVSVTGDRFRVAGVPRKEARALTLFGRRADLGAFLLREVTETAGLSVTVVMMNPGGRQPRVAEAYARVAEIPLEEDGPMHRYVARVDPRTGRYRGARALIDGDLRAFMHDPVSGAEFSGEVPGWAEIQGKLQEMCAFTPQLRFLSFTVNANAAGFRITAIEADPQYSSLYPWSADTLSFLRELVVQRRELHPRARDRIRRGWRLARLKIRREFAALFFPRGLVPYQATRWPGDVRRDLFQRNGVPLRTKLWAYRHGFLSYRIAQYGITAENREQFISDFEYRWLRHINIRYKTFLEDKVSVKYVAAEFNEFLPGYYFSTTRSNGRNHLVPLMDCPEGYGPDFDEVLRLTREKGVLALKPDEGSHGEGFYRLAWDGEQYWLNENPASAETVLQILADPANRYLVTEFIQMHPTLAAIYPHSVNTIRMIVFKKDGVTPQLGNCYLRIGSSESGFVDNTAAGGMLAQIDASTGRFGEAKALVQGRVEACPRHPDTGVLIEGVIPHWERIKEQILQIARGLPQLEYLGFDVAVTPEGFTLPEINRFPDYPRIDRLTPETIDYLLHKLAQKKRRFGYDRRRPRTLVSLPRRSAW